MKSNLIVLIAAELFVTVMVVVGVVFWWNSDEARADSQTDDRSLTQFTENFSEAFESADFKELRKLIFWEGVDRLTEDAAVESWTNDLRHDLVQVESLDLEPNQMTEYEIQGVRYRPNLEPLRQLKIHYVDVDTHEAGWTSCLLGKHNGRFYITLAVPSPETKSSAVRSSNATND